jgi:uncharacterized protein (DUF1800 family)
VRRVHHRTISLAALGAVLTLPAAAQPSAGSDVREQTADQQVRHALNRLTFGARPGDYERVRVMGVDAWIAQQLQPARIADPALTPVLAELVSYHKTPSELRRDYPPGAQLQQQMARAQQAGRPVDSAAYRRQLAEGRRVYADVQTARVLRAVVTERQLDEVMVDFWLNHFSVYGAKNQQMRYYLAQYEKDVIRPHALGDFRTLLGAVAGSAAMLTYLDNAQSSADSGRPVLGRPALRAAADRRRQQAVQQNPLLNNVAGRRGLNENYARELLELHTLGVDGGYTQQDVIEVARAFTGWTVRPPTLPGADAFLFNPLNHDAGEKKVLGHTLRAGRGLEDGQQVLDILAAHPSTARYIAHKLAVRFVSDEPPAALVDRAAAVFTTTKGDIREVLRTIITSPEFFAADAYRAKVKTPFELVVSAARATGATPDRTAQTSLMIASLGQPVFGRQTPDGWPETGDEWINTGAILNRINFGVAVAAGRLPGVSARTWPLMQELAGQPRAAQVDGVANALLGGEISPETRQILIDGNNPLATAVPGADEPPVAMRGRRAQMAPPPRDVTGQDPQMFIQAQMGRAFQNLPPLQGLQQVVGLALGSPEFQRR